MEVLELRDGTPAVFWPLLSTDWEDLAAAYRELSPESRRNRFLTAVEELTPAMQERLVDEVDGVDHVALVLFAEVGEAFDPVGVGRIVRYDEDPQAADIAVTVRDDWHGRGVATGLVAELVRQRPAGVTHLVTQMLADNPASRRMLERIGPTRVEHEGNGVLGVQVDVAGHGDWNAAVQSDRQQARRRGWWRWPL